MKLRVLVTIADDYQSRLPDVVRRMQRAGLRVEQILEAIGVVSGAIEAGALPKLKAVPGVQSIEPDREVDALSGEFNDRA